MQLILARHGNTFAPGDKVVWVGSRNDLPLVASGVEQAHVLARAIRAAGMRPALVLAGPLSRTREYARTVALDLELGFEPEVDARLDEIDYGSWSGLTDQEVIARCGKEPFEAWANHSRWPEGAGWHPSELQIVARVRELTAELTARFPGERVLLVTSNGVLRYFLKLLPGEFEKRASKGDFKVKTGHVCGIEMAGDNGRLKFWNKEPEHGLFA